MSLVTVTVCQTFTRRGAARVLACVALGTIGVSLAMSIPPTASARLNVGRRGASAPAPQHAKTPRCNAVVRPTEFLVGVILSFQNMTCASARTITFQYLFRQPAQRNLHGFVCRGVPRTHGQVTCSSGERSVRFIGEFAS